MRIPPLQLAWMVGPSSPLPDDRRREGERERERERADMSLNLLPLLLLPPPSRCERGDSGECRKEKEEREIQHRRRCSDRSREKFAIRGGAQYARKKFLPFPAIAVIKMAWGRF